MAEDRPAASVMEFLTHPNPTVHHLPPNSISTTHDHDFYWPKEIKKWDQFEDLEILRSAFRGRLYDTATQPSRKSLRYPYYKDEIDCRIRDEKKTRTLVDKWNHSIVTQALEEVDEFRPSYWVNDERPTNIDKANLPLSPTSGDGSFEPPTATRRQPARGCAVETKRPRQMSRHRRIPDAGSIILAKGSDETIENDSVERFPKEYKPAGKWSTDMSIQQDLLSRGREPHRWEKSHINKNQAWPIRQAFTYCIENMCRYGCILTCQEAFIFQIQPLGQELEETQTPEQLRRALINWGKMEYVSIPWENHNQGNTEPTRSWTVNLALWFIHVLAGHRYEVAWRYDLREHEKLGDALPLSSRTHTAHEDSGSSHRRENMDAIVDVEAEESDISNNSDESASSEDEEVRGSRIPLSANETRPSKEEPVTPKKRKRDSGSPDSTERLHFSFSRHNG